MEMFRRSLRVSSSAAPAESLPDEARAEHTSSAADAEASPVPSVTPPSKKRKEPSSAADLAVGPLTRRSSSRRKLKASQDAEAVPPRTSEDFLGGHVQGGIPAAVAQAAYEALAPILPEGAVEAAKARGDVAAAIEVQGFFSFALLHLVDFGRRLSERGLEAVPYLKAIAAAEREKTRLAEELDARNAEVGKMEEGLSSARSEVKEQREKVKAAEKKVSALNKQVSTLEKRVKKEEEARAVLEGKVAAFPAELSKAEAQAVERFKGSDEFLDEVADKVTEGGRVGFDMLRRFILLYPGEDISGLSFQEAFERVSAADESPVAVEPPAAAESPAAAPRGPEPAPVVEITDLASPAKESGEADAFQDLEEL